MNKLFEEFVFEIMKKYENEFSCKLTSQRGRKLLDGDTSKKRNTFVDIMVEKNIDNKNSLEKIVLDTKYKKFITADDFSNSDVFQVATYCLLHDAKKAILVYPRWNKLVPQIPSFYLNNGKKDIKIDFKTIDLCYQNLKQHISDIKKDINDILNIA